MRLCFFILVMLVSLGVLSACGKRPSLLESPSRPADIKAGYPNREAAPSIGTAQGTAR